MNKFKIKWCCEQAKGIVFVELKPHLSESYMKEADDSFKVCSKLEDKWKVITGYYACYNAFYSLLMKAGIKCEIHDCSIELMEFFDFTEHEVKFLKKLKKDRIQTQYYLKDVVLNNEKKVMNFVIRCKELLEELDSEKIEKIRSEIKRV